MENEKDFVEAIEDGRIVKVPESYAKREGLLILKKSPMQTQKQLPPSYLEKRERSDKFKPLTEYIKAKPDWREKQVLSELVDNFNWQIRYTRRRLGLTRKQLAKMINVSDSDLKIIESGRLPSNDFILINKIQSALNINLRKDGKKFDVSATELMHKAATEKPAQKLASKKEVEDYNAFLGKDIEILDDE